MHCGKQPDVQLCVQADAGTGSSHHLAALPARLNTALEFMRQIVSHLVLGRFAGKGEWKTCSGRPDVYNLELKA